MVHNFPDTALLMDMAIARLLESVGRVYQRNDVNMQVGTVSTSMSQPMTYSQESKHALQSCRMRAKELRVALNAQRAQNKSAIVVSDWYTTLYSHSSLIDGHLLR